MGKGSLVCIITLVERKSGHLLIEIFKNRTTKHLNARTIWLINNSPFTFTTITADNGTEFHQYPVIEKPTNTTFYFANLYHSCERGINENCNELIRQHLPKGTSVASSTQQQCNQIAKCLNACPRKRHNHKTPEEIIYAKQLFLSHVRLNTKHQLLISMSFSCAY